MTQLLQRTPNGLYCELGDFYVDPWRPVPRAVITHAHADHARAGCDNYLASSPSQQVMQLRLGGSSSTGGQQSRFEYLRYGESQRCGEVTVTLYPAGHVLGSAQVCIEYRGQRVVVSGDYKRQFDCTCETFEPVRCHSFVTESTFGLPIYRWPDSEIVFQQINQWWRENQQANRASLLLAYSLGKAQRVLGGIDSSIGPILCHGAVQKTNAAYRSSGVSLPETTLVSEASKDFEWSRALIVAPPSVAGGTWIRRFGKLSTAMASGWMLIRGTRRRRAVDRGFVLSDHVDWQDLMQTIQETEAEQIWVTHGYSDIVVRHLREQGFSKAESLETEFEGDNIDASEDAADDDHIADVHEAHADESSDFAEEP